MTPLQTAAAALSATAAVGWLFFLFAGRTRGSVKRLAFRGTLVALCGGLLVIGRRTGALAQAGQAGRLVVLAVVGLLVLSYLYLVRFCPSCGRMHRNFKLLACARCGTPLPQHGLTNKPRRAAPQAPGTQARKRLLL